jgi:hypothetical protein
VCPPARLDGSEVIAPDLSESYGGVRRGIYSGVLRNQQIENPLRVRLGQRALIVGSDPEPSGEVIRYDLLAWASLLKPIGLFDVTVPSRPMASARKLPSLASLCVQAQTA